MELIETLLKVSVPNGVGDRSIEVGVKRADDRAVCFLDRHHGKDGAERGMDVNDVVLSEAEYPSQVLSQLESPRESRLRSIGVHRLALADANDVWLVPRARNVRRNDVDVVAVAARLAGEEVHVLADAAEVGIVVLRHQRDA